MKYVKLNDEDGRTSLTFVEIDLSLAESYEIITEQLTTAISEGKVHLQGVSDETGLVLISMASGKRHKLVCSEVAFRESWNKAKKTVLLG
jgi:hypothetical protein